MAKGLLSAAFFASISACFFWYST
ncbi:hypothetical protein [Fusibacter sp. A1]